MTGSEKISLITHVSRFNHEQNGTWINCKISYSKQATFKWSTYAGCFSEAQWWSVQVVCCPNGGLASLGMAAQLCGAEQKCLLKISLHFSQFKDLCGHNLAWCIPIPLSLKNLKPPSCLPPSPMLELTWYSQHQVKSCLKWWETWQGNFGS